MNIGNTYRKCKKTAYKKACDGGHMGGCFNLGNLEKCIEVTLPKQEDSTKRRVTGDI